MSPFLAMTGTFLLGMAMTAPVGADDYPYSGFFATSLPDESIADTQLSCANGFFRQGTDGSFVNYHLDAARYDSDSTIRYVRYGAGLCTLLEDKRTEACKMEFSTDPQEIGAVYVDVIEKVEPDVITLAYFDTIPEAWSYIAGKGPEPDKSTFVRCPGYTDERMAGFVTEEVSTLSIEDRDAVMSPDLTDATRARMKGIVDQLVPNP